IGGGYGGLNAARALDDVADVTLVEQRDAFVHNVASLRALTEPGWLTGIFIPYDHLLGNGRVVWDRAVDVDVGRAGLASGAELSADFLVLATGSTYPFPAKTDRLRTQQSIDHYREANRELSRAQRVLILGAGPVGIELAGEISSAWPEKSITIVDQEPEVVPGPFK